MVRDGRKSWINPQTSDQGQLMNKQAMVSIPGVMDAINNLHNAAETTSTNLVLDTKPIKARVTSQHGQQGEVVALEMFLSKMIEWGSC